MAAMFEPAPEMRITIFFTLGLSLFTSAKLKFVAAKTPFLRTVVLKTHLS
jgi:hypothetical protein